MLRIVNTPAPEDWYISGVFIENGPITTAIGSGAAAPAPPVSSPTIAPTVPPTSAPASTPVASPTSSATGPLASQYGQCGGAYICALFTSGGADLTLIDSGTGYTGPTVCASPFTCKAISPPYYYQVCIYVIVALFGYADDLAVPMK